MIAEPTPRGYGGPAVRPDPRHFRRASQTSWRNMEKQVSALHTLVPNVGRCSSTCRLLLVACVFFVTGCRRDRQNSLQPGSNIVAWQTDFAQFMTQARKEVAALPESAPGQSLDHTFGGRQVEWGLVYQGHEEFMVGSNILTRIIFDLSDFGIHGGRCMAPLTLEVSSGPIDFNGGKQGRLTSDMYSAMAQSAALRRYASYWIGNAPYESSVRTTYTCTLSERDRWREVPVNTFVRIGGCIDYTAFFLCTIEPDYSGGYTVKYNGGSVGNPGIRSEGTCKIAGVNLTHVVPANTR